MFKPGDKVVFDWNCQYHKDNGNTTSMQVLFRRWGENTNKIFTIKEIGNKCCTLVEHTENVYMVRLKKVNTWSVEYKKRGKNV